ncbi:MAG: hypothetical protein ACLP01_15630 [Solirubrobacteraceae bacterium]
MNDDLEIRELIAAAVGSDLAPEQLEARLHEVAWDVEAEPQRTFLATALRLLAEFSNGDWTLDELRGRLGALNRLYWFELAPKSSFADSTAQFIECEVAPAAGAGTQHVTASA